MPGRDLPVHAGDWTAMIGTADELAARGIKVRGRPQRAHAASAAADLDTARTLRDDVNPMFLRVGRRAGPGGRSTVLLRFIYQRPGCRGSTPCIHLRDDHNGGLRRIHLRPTAHLAATVRHHADVCRRDRYRCPRRVPCRPALSRRFVQTAGLRRARHLRNHIIVVGLGSFGIRVVSDLTAAGYDVAVIERDENNRFLSSAAELDVPVIFGDATMRQTLEAARVDTPARSRC